VQFELPIYDCNLAVFDEFHLIHHWGITFRPGLMMAFENLVNNLDLPVVGAEYFE
jgi:superfamily II DNA helicase RecQ